MVPIAERSVPTGTYHVPPREPTQRKKAELLRKNRMLFGAREPN